MFAVMEPLDGQTLGARLGEERLSTREAFEISLQIADLFAFGAIVYETLAGTRALKGDSAPRRPTDSALASCAAP